MVLKEQISSLGLGVHLVSLYEIHLYPETVEVLTIKVRISSKVDMNKVLSRPWHH